MKAQIKVACTRQSLALIRDFVKSRLRDMEVSTKESDQIVLATDEACANCIIHHHQCDQNSSIEVSLYKQKDVVYIEIKDKGSAFPIHTYKPSKIEDIVKKRAKGGLGIMLINKLMDEVQIEEHLDHFIYKLGKYISKSAEM
ncbi:MAG: ATP-binding protein [Bacteroidota bacterium]